MSNRIHELLHRNLQEVFGESDAGRRCAAIDELYTEDCVLYVPPGPFVGREALDKFAGDLRATHPHFAYAPHGEPPGPPQCRSSCLGFRPSQRGARLHGSGCDRSRRQDRGALRVPRFGAFIGGTALSLVSEPIQTSAPSRVVIAPILERFIATLRRRGQGSRRESLQTLGAWERDAGSTAIGSEGVRSGQCSRRAQ